MDNVAGQILNQMIDLAAILHPPALASQSVLGSDHRQSAQLFGVGSF
jgi:hypothetical protein